MGLFSFLRGKGKNLGAAQAEGAPPSKEDLEKEVAELGLDTTGVELDVDPDEGRVTIKGAPKEQETREKLILAVGNVEGIGEVADESSGPEPHFYDVQPGDSLWKIAAETLGDGNRYTEIFEANRPMLSDPDKIYPGQKLRIPS